MEKIGRLFVNNPAGIFLVSGLFFAAFLLLRDSNRVSHPKALLWPATFWAIWAVWELIVTRLSPEANIRVDLLILIPAALIVSAFGIIRLFWGK
jgi:hypothetical protein